MTQLQRRVGGGGGVTGATPRGIEPCLVVRVEGGVYGGSGARGRAGQRRVGRELVAQRDGMVVRGDVDSCRPAVVQVPVAEERVGGFVVTAAGNLEYDQAPGFVEFFALHRVQQRQDDAAGDAVAGVYVRAAQRGGVVVMSHWVSLMSGLASGGVVGRGAGAWGNKRLPRARVMGERHARRESAAWVRQR